MTAWLLAAACAALAHGSTPAGGMAPSAPGTPALEAQAGCAARWVPTFGGWPGVDGPVEDLAVFDDGLGNGPQLYVAGRFERAGDVEAKLIARWDGLAWAPVGAPLGGTTAVEIRALIVFDDGRGPALYAGGRFPGGNVARWDGHEWTFLPGLAASVWAFAVFEVDGQPALHAGGSFGNGNVARWDGARWLPLGAGVAGPVGGAFAPVTAMTVYDDGQGPALFVGGGFNLAGGAPAANIARWDGLHWAPLDSGLDGGVMDLEAFDDGSGPALFVGGFFQTAGGLSAVKVARWTSTGWATAGGHGFAVHAFGTFPDPSGGPGVLYASGFEGALKRWNGSGWVTEVGSFGRADAIVSYDDGRGGGPELYLGGTLRHQGDGVNEITTNYVARWNGSRWRALANCVDGRVDALAELGDGHEGTLVVGGRFRHAGEHVAGNVVSWDGASWVPLGEGTDGPVQALASFDDGRRGRGLVAGGDFLSADGLPASHVARWDGQAWWPLGSGVDGPVLALLAHREAGRPVLYVGGSFRNAGGQPANRIARWNGREWSPLGAGFDGSVLALAVFDDGRGERLYAGGEFRNAGGAPASFIARWDGTSWEAFGQQAPNARVRVLTVYDDPLAGRGLIAGGDFTALGTLPAIRIARWKASGWQALAEVGMNASVRALEVFDAEQGGAPLLLVGGDFALVGSTSTGPLVSWNGQRFARFAAWIDTSVYALHGRASAGGTGPVLFVGGSFPIGQPSGDSRLARYQRCPDVTPPRLYSPTSLRVEDDPLDGMGEVVSFTLHVEDDLDNRPTLIASPPSGSRFPPGTTRVHCKAIDGSGNATSREFPVHVVPAPVTERARER